MRFYKLHIFLISGILLLSGCAPQTAKMYEGPELSENSLARVHVVGFFPPEVEHQTFYEIKYVDNAPPSPGMILLLKPGMHTLSAQWGKIRDSNTHTSIAGIYPNFVPVINMDVTAVYSSDLYHFPLDLKAGKTYVIDLTPAVNNDTQAPEALCMTEEDHGAPANEGDIRGTRIPSAYAKRISCTRAKSRDVYTKKIER
jgi:hypothetical protein